MPHFLFQISRWWKPAGHIRALKMKTQRGERDNKCCGKANKWKEGGEDQKSKVGRRREEQRLAVRSCPGLRCSFVYRHNNVSSLVAAERRCVGLLGHDNPHNSETEREKKLCILLPLCLSECWLKEHQTQSEQQKWGCWRCGPRHYHMTTPPL